VRRSRSTRAPGPEPLRSTLKSSGLERSGSCPQARGSVVGVMLVAVVDGVMRLVDEVDGELVDRVSGVVLDPARIVLVGLEVDRVAALAVA
jgi:hypothetical protein